MSTEYRVRAGDTLSSIARRHGCSLESLRGANPKIEPAKMAIGSSIVIPDIRERATTRRPAEKSLVPGKMSSRQGVLSVDAAVREIWEPIEEGVEAVYMHGIRLWHGMSDQMLAWLREIESTELTHAEARTKTQARQPQTHQAPKADKGAQPASVRNAARKHRDEVLQSLRDRLYTIPHVVETRGVTLTRNERKMIVAAVGLCEISNDVFGSLNKDQEFAGRRFGRRGIKVGYSRIVHIGLSYGYIQFTQDSGSLGRVLQRMRGKVHPDVFKRYFPNADQLIQLTTDGLPGDTYNRYGKSGQAYWNGLSADQKKPLINRANRDANWDNRPDHPLGPDEEIRGARVQKIPYDKDLPPIDLWEDYGSKPDDTNFAGWASAFRAAGDVPEFQDAQLELAIEGYFNKVLKYCAESNIRSAMGLAMVLACAVRYGANHPRVALFTQVGEEECGIKDCFTDPQQELDTIKAIANAKESTAGVTACVGSLKFPLFEKHRAAKLLRDEFDFLTEDLYDPATYDEVYDK